MAKRARAERHFEIAQEARDLRGRSTTDLNRAVADGVAKGKLTQSNAVEGGLAERDRQIGLRRQVFDELRDAAPDFDATGLADIRELETHRHGDGGGGGHALSKRNYRSSALHGIQRADWRGCARWRSAAGNVTHGLPLECRVSLTLSQRGAGRPRLNCTGAGLFSRDGYAAFIRITSRSPHQSSMS
jgi:hypothetical protein